ncbi:MAG: hypothetical protein JWO37_367 [Acidimicrobiales bacterium]|jgi:hypothetical protein|nr:hypothetical protein [Acidimicrobiales bacterium]
MQQMAAQSKSNKAPMSDAHKAALAEGRDQGRAVRRYLEALDLHKPKRGRKQTPESIKRQLADIEAKLESADPLTRLQLRQKRRDLQARLDAGQPAVDLTALEADFVVAAKPYGARKGISYAVWREAGVDAAVLRKAGISRGA